jgi:hypothetical protein
MSGISLRKSYQVPSIAHNDTGMFLGYLWVGHNPMAQGDSSEYEVQDS